MAAEKWIYLQFFSPFCQLDHNASFGWIYNDGDGTAVVVFFSPSESHCYYPLYGRPEMPIYGTVEPSGAYTARLIIIGKLPGK